jgi:hypothetical protein
MGSRQAICATIGGAFATGAAVGTLVAERLEGIAGAVAVLIALASLALALVGLYAFMHRNGR